MPPNPTCAWIYDFAELVSISKRSWAHLVQKISQDIWFALVLNESLQLLTVLNIRNKHPICALNLPGSSSQQTLLQVCPVNQRLPLAFWFSHTVLWPLHPANLPILSPSPTQIHMHIINTAQKSTCQSSAGKDNLNSITYTVTPPPFFLIVFSRTFRLLKKLTESPINKYITMRGSKRKEEVTISD